MGVELVGAGVLHDAPLAQHRHLVGQRQGLVLVVGHQHGGGPGPAQDVAHLGPEAGSQRRVQGREGLVQQDQGRLHRQGPGQRHPLLLATGELIRVATIEAAQSDHLEQLGHPGLLAAPVGQSEGHVGGHRQVGEQGALLGDVPQSAPLGRLAAATVVHDRVADADSTLVDAVEAGHQPQQRGLAAARRPQDGGDRLGLDGQVHPAEHGLVGVALVDTRQLEVAHDADPPLGAGRAPTRAEPGVTGPAGGSGGPGRARCRQWRCVGRTSGPARSWGPRRWPPGWPRTVRPRRTRRWSGRPRTGWPGCGCRWGSGSGWPSARSRPTGRPGRTRRPARGRSGAESPAGRPRSGPRPSDRAVSGSPTGACATEASTQISANGKNRMV